MTTPRKSAPHKAVRRPTKPKSDQFEYTLEDGRVLTLPPFNSVKPGIVRKIRKLNEVDQFFTVVEALVDEESLEVIDNLDNDEFQALQKAWYEHAGVDLGES